MASRAGKSTFRRLLEAVRPHRWMLGAAIAASCVAAGAAAGYAYLVGPLLKGLLSGKGLGGQPLWGLPPETALPLAIIVLAAARALATFLQSGWMLEVGQKVIRKLRDDLYFRLLELPPAFFEQRHSGDLLSRFSGDVSRVNFAVTQALGAYVRDGLQILALLGVCLWIDWRLFLLAFVVLPVDVLAVSRFSKWVKRIAHRTQASLGAVLTLAAEQLRNAAVVQAYNAQGAVLGRFDDEQSRYLRAMKRSLFLRGAYSPTVELLGTVGVAAAIGFGAQAVGASPALAGKLLSFLSAAFLLYPPLKSISGTFGLTVQGLASAERLYEILDAEVPPDGDEVAGPLRDALVLKSVGVTYADGRRALDGLSLVVPAGSTAALVGASGAGKSTTLSLLLGFLTPTDGEILWDGVPLSRFSRASIRAQIGWVSQEPMLFSGSVRDNLRLGLGASPSDEALWKALASAHADGFVRALPNGLDAQVGESGAKLSGGQRQRLAIARAFLRAPSVLVLDEPTSALDAASEREVSLGLEELMRGRTVVVVAHRLSTVRHATALHVLENGRVVESGTHEELTARGGRYAALLQTGEMAA